MTYLEKASHYLNTIRPAKENKPNELSSRWLPELLGFQCVRVTQMWAVVLRAVWSVWWRWWPWICDIIVVVSVVAACCQEHDEEQKNNGTDDPSSSLGRVFWEDS